MMQRVGSQGATIVATSLIIEVQVTTEVQALRPARWSTVRPCFQVPLLKSQMSAGGLAQAGTPSN